MKTQFVLALTLCVTAFSLPGFAGDWPHWRGPHFNGTAERAGLPEEVDLASDVRWATDLPGPSSSTPIIVGDRVFLASNDSTLKKAYAMCLDRATGKVLWQKEVAQFEKVPPRNTLASCSPVASDSAVYFTYGNGDVFAMDHDGNTLWSKNLNDAYENAYPQFGYSSSPLLLKGKLYYPILVGQWRLGVKMMEFTQEHSRIVCLDAESGEEVWNTHRPTEAVGESFDSYGSAVPYLANGVEAIVTQGGDMLTAHDAATGEELWRQDHNPRRAANWRVIPTPVVMDDIVFGAQPRGLDGFAVKPSDKKHFDYEESFWILEGRTTDVPSAAYYKGKLYVLNGVRGELLCVDPKSGDLLWEDDLDPGARIWASPTVADDKVYCLDENGQLTIASIGDGAEVLSRTEFGGDEVKASVAIAAGDLFVRTSEKLYCVGK